MEAEDIERLRDLWTALRQTRDPLLAGWGYDDLILDVLEEVKK